MNSKKAVTLLVLATLLLMVLPVMPIAAKGGKGKDKGTKIQDGTLQASTGETLTVGFDEYGYNYQGHMFKGIYSDYDRVHGGPYSDVKLIMKWNEAWMANTDKDGDGLLDRHYGFDSYIGSGAWCTNHQSGEYEDELGEMIKWNYFVKIVAVPADATMSGGVWFTADGDEIGPDIWGAFAIIQQVENDAGYGYDVHGLQYISPTNAGLGAYK